MRIHGSVVLPCIAVIWLLDRTYSLGYATGKFIISSYPERCTDDRGVARLQLVDCADCKLVVTRDFGAWNHPNST